MAQSKREIINNAKAALRSNPYDDFETQAPHLACLLEQLPLLEASDPAVQRALTRGGEQMDLRSVLDRLKASWMAQHPAGSHDGVFDLELGPETEQLVINFSLFLWGQSNVVRRLEVARIGPEAFIYWDQGQPAPPQITEAGRSKEDAPKKKRGWLAWLKGLKH